MPRSAVRLAREGRLRFDPEAAEACLLATAAECPAFAQYLYEAYFVPGDGLGSPCRDVFEVVPPSAPGTPCTADFECGDGLFCPHNFDGPCGGRCAHMYALGEECIFSAHCRYSGRGEYGGCAPDTPGFEWEVRSPLRCSAIHVLSPPASEGGLCGWMERDGDDVTFLPCPEGLRCGFAPDGYNRCIRNPGPGEDCGLPPPAGLDGACRPGSGCTAGVCEPFDLGVDDRSPGEPCWNRSYCDPTFRLACDGTSGLCREWGDGSEGAVCHDLVAPCNAGLFCDFDSGFLRSGICRALVPVGETCFGHLWCETSCCQREPRLGGGTCTPAPF